jgi:hypothetical protein
MKGEYSEGKEATERFEKTMKSLFRALKPPKSANRRINSAGVVTLTKNLVSTF